MTGKKLLILGANPETSALVLVAKDMGAFTIVTDYDPKSDAKKYADKSYDIDAADVDALAKLAEREQIDGVLVGVADALIVPYQKLCETLGLPCYATKEQAQILTNKKLFKQKCQTFGIQGVPEYPQGEGAEGIRYPVVVKPADSNSGKGISLCDSEEKLQAAIEKALRFSGTQTYLLEEYMDCADVSIYYTIQNGEAYLSSLSDRHTCKGQTGLSPVCLGDVFPSRLLELFLREEHPKFCRMFRDMNLQNAVFYTSAFYRDGVFYVYDPGFRLQGGGFHLILNAACGFDHRRMLIRYALTGSMGEDVGRCNDPALGGKAAAVIWFLLGAGEIAKIEGMEFVARQREVIHAVQRFQEGDIVPEFALGTERQVFLRLFVVCGDQSRLRALVRELQEKVRVFDALGASMVLDGIDVETAI